MQLTIIILKKTEALDGLLKGFARSGIRGATIIDSTGMASRLASSNDFEDISFLGLGSLRSILNPERESCKTILIANEDSQVSLIKDLVTEYVGDLTQPNMGIMFTVPITNIYGGVFS